MILEEICPRLLWRVDSFSTATLRKSTAFRYLNSDWQWEYAIRLDNSNNDLVQKSVVFLTRLSPCDDGNRVKRFLSFVCIKTPEGRRTLEQMHTYDMMPRNRWLVFEIEKENIVKKGLIWKDGCIFSCSLEPFGTYEQLASLEKESQKFTSSCLESVSTDVGKLLKDYTFADITLECGSLLIPAHRSVLAIRSEKLSILLKSDRDSTPVHLTVDDMEPEVLQAIIGYIYTGNIELSTENVRRIYKASLEYGIPSLMHRSALFIMERLSSFDACDILLLAEECKDNYLKTMVSSHIANEISTLNSEEWKTFSENHKMLAIEVFRIFVERTYVRS